MVAWVKRELLAAVLAGSLVATGSAADELRTIEVISGFSSGPGSVREAIAQANAQPEVRSRIVSRLPRGTVVHVFRALPPLVAPGLVFEGNGVVLQGGSCVRPDGRAGCDGLVVAGRDIVVRDVVTTGFTFDGIAVRGLDAVGVRIENCRSHANQDDGIGVSHGAEDVLIQGCTLENNGFRTKGKGALVFEHASARLLHNVIRGNRDGVTVSSRARAELVGNTVADNYDKGVGVAGAELTGRDNVIRGNGRKTEAADAPPPNADGLRVTLDSTVVLSDTQIVDNGDAGVVALGTSTVGLSGGRIAGNGSVGVHAGDSAVVELRDVAVEQAEGMALRTEDGGRIVRVDAGAPGGRPKGKTSTDASLDDLDDVANDR